MSCYYYSSSLFFKYSKNIVYYILRKLHTPVMSDAVIKAFKPKNGEVFIDMTFGAGGHTKHLLTSALDTKVYALDRDPTAYALAKQLSEIYPGRVIPLLGKFSDLPTILKEHNVKQNSIDGVLFDLGCSSMQFDTAHRGFSISKNGPLDMRMDGDRVNNSLTAADVLARIHERDLIKILSIYGEERQAKKIARAIIETRYTFRKLQTTEDLGNLVAELLDTEIRHDKLQRPTHVATKVFQALRIFVNNELNELNYGMIIAYNYIKFGGRIVTLSFHSLEDRIIKGHLTGNIFASNSVPLLPSNFSYESCEVPVSELTKKYWRPIYKHVLTPTQEEIHSNPRSRSAKLRAAIKILS